MSARYEDAIVMVDSPEAELDANQKERIARAFGETAVPNAGYLTAMKAYYFA